MNITAYNGAAHSELQYAHDEQYESAGMLDECRKPYEPTRTLHRLTSGRYRHQHHEYARYPRRGADKNRRKKSNNVVTARK